MSDGTPGDGVAEPFFVVQFGESSLETGDHPFDVILRDLGAIFERAPAERRTEIAAAKRVTVMIYVE